MPARLMPIAPSMSRTMCSHRWSPMLSVAMS
jgi:hypothetical protein